jgi:hypothetical protein
MSEVGSDSVIAVCPLHDRSSTETGRPSAILLVKSANQRHHLPIIQSPGAGERPPFAERHLWNVPRPVKLTPA